MPHAHETITVSIVLYLLISMFVCITDSSLRVLYLAFFFLKKKTSVCVFVYVKIDET
ncbi:uncharacterized protein RHIMIDRAFT_32214 [Rhizopus microsporus ATCC 52813]|uniref:Uncharacterized protein n=1 Tax=Rhizopus microsporus ATCC 52813 TaxID=1340429 RepID=A0A2G4SPD2_RHIZD|nr:uncharacterized protein RHIMIDRAFT_32214 [Rhizopus microsporus ATCC 52813]PHZ10624.1 hypothetical protein RHIMIDRAFT_32214 [Rhizopus microsporus ATCC 52813]